MMKEIKKKQHRLMSVSLVGDLNINFSAKNGLLIVAQIAHLIRSEGRGRVADSAPLAAL